MSNEPCPSWRAALLLALAAIVSGCSGKPADAPQHLGFDPNDLAREVRPQDDFFAYVNARWLAANPIPPEWSAYGVSHVILERTEQHLHEILRDAQASDQPEHADALIGALFAAFMDETRANALGVAPLAPMLGEVDAARTHADVWRLFGSLYACGVEGPVQFYIDAAADDPTRLLVYFWQAGLGLPDRDYYLEPGETFEALRADYARHIREMRELAGWQDADAAAATIGAIEQRIAAIHWSSTANRDRERIYGNRFTPGEAAVHAPQVDWQAYFDGAGLGAPAQFVLAQDTYFPALGLLVAEFPVAQWQVYLRFRVLKAYADFLSAPIVAANFAFEGTKMRGQEEQRARWKRGVRLVNTELGEPLGRRYVRQHFPESSRVLVTQMVEHIREAFRASIRALDWMNAATRIAAEAKLDRFVAKLGYPQAWRDYTALDLTAGNLVDKVRAVRAFEHAYELGKLTRPVDRGEWGMSPQTVNAYYRPTFNEIVFPAAILQPPLFDPSADPAANYGAIGAVIGHEFSHGFDDQGRKFDGEGRLRDWWTAEDAAEYLARSAALIDQYNEFQALPDVAVNGALTLGENIGDLAGATMSLRAYLRSLGGVEPPVIGGFTAVERFFVSYAQSWRSHARPEYERELLLSDSHAPARYRVNGVVRNMPEFHASWHLAPGDGLYLAPEARVRIW